jgi:predicted PurR-regulated permease PerM
MGKWLVPVLALGVLLFLARSIMPPFVVAAALAYIFSPVVDRIEERTHQRRVLVVGVFFVLLLSLLGLGIWLIEAQLAREVQDLSRRGPNLVDTAVVRLLGTDNLQFMGQRVDPTTWPSGSTARLPALWATRPMRSTSPSERWTRWRRSC